MSPTTNRGRWPGERTFEEGLASGATGAVVDILATEDRGRKDARAIEGRKHVVEIDEVGGGTCRKAEFRRMHLEGGWVGCPRPAAGRGPRGGDEATRGRRQQARCTCRGACASDSFTYFGWYRLVSG